MSAAVHPKSCWDAGCLCLLCQGTALGHLGSGIEPWQGACPHLSHGRGGWRESLSLCECQGGVPQGDLGCGWLLPFATFSLWHCQHAAISQSFLAIPFWQWGTSGAHWVRHWGRRVHPVSSACWALNAGVAGTCRPAAAAHGLFSHILIQMLILWMPL